MKKINMWDIKEKKYALGQGIGNSQTGAIQWVKDNPLYAGLTEEELDLKIEEKKLKYLVSNVELFEDMMEAWLAKHSETPIDPVSGEEIIDVETPMQ